MREIKIIVGNIFVIAFLTISLFLLGLNDINKALVYILILLIGIVFFFLFMKIQTKVVLSVVEINNNQKKKTKKNKKKLIHLERIIKLFFYGFFIIVIFSFWFGKGGNIWLEKSVHFFNRRFSNKIVFNIAVFLVPFVYWISIESIYRNLFSYLYKKYKLDEIID